MSGRAGTSTVMSPLIRFIDPVLLEVTTMTSNIRTLRTAAIVLALVPVGACAKPGDENTSSANAAVPAYPEEQAQRSAMTLQDFQKRQGGRLMAADTDGDGSISKAEFMAVNKTGKGNPEKRFARMDLNGDGILDKNEINAMVTQRFKRIDTDGNGSITPQERSAARAEKHDEKHEIDGNGAVGNGSDS